MNYQGLAFSSVKNASNKYKNHQCKETSININNKNNKNEITKKEEKLFKSLKNKTHPFFKNTLINSCSHIIVKNGQTLAIPFNIKNLKGRNLSHYRSMPMKSSELTSIYRKDYSVKPILHCGMDKKPLEPYNSLSYRNRLPINDYCISSTHNSNIKLGNKNRLSRKQWISTYRDTYSKPIILPICNTGILSENSKKIHKKLLDI